MRSGQLIADRYRLVELIGSGASGLVWLADDTQEDTQVALKRPHSVDGPGVRAELEREAGIAARVRHPGAVKVFGVVGDDGDCWLVMEYFPSENLGRLMRRGEPLEPLAVARIGAQVASALAAAHEVDVVHRDVTPNNILVDEHGTAKVTDYGISAYRAQTMTTSGKISGTAVYVSPEVANGKGAMAPSDVFSLGASLFAAVEGEPPFGFGEPEAILARVRDGRREPAERAGPLAPVLDALLLVDRDARPSAGEARELLDAVARGRSVTWTAPRKGPRWGRRIALAGAVAVAVVVALLVVFGLPPWGTSGDPGPLRTVTGDERTADPCAVLDPEALRRYGPAQLDRHYANFDRCDVIVEVDGAEIDVLAQLLGPVEEGAASSPSSGATVSAEPPEPDGDGACDVTLFLADGNRVDVEARPQDRTDLDTCPIARTAGERALELLPGGELARRAEPFDPSSLALVDACSLADTAALARLPGLAEATPEPEFGGWACSWDSATASMRARVIFDRNVPFDGGDGELVSLGGRDALVEPRGYGEESCVVNVINRPYVDENGDDHVELAKIVIDGDVAPVELCARAKDLARSVAVNLPPV